MKNKLDYCYHTHTSRCGHATGEDEEYVLKAIEAGFKRLGISDHIFLPGISQRRVRGDYDFLNHYLETFNKLRDKYIDKIEIKIGFEAEYLPSFLSYYQELLSSRKIDYLILGQHYHEVDGRLMLFTPSEYAEDIVNALDTGLFTYVAHPDLFLLADDRWNDSNIEVSRKILKACETHHIPIEINVCGIRANRPYPSRDFFKLSKEYDLEYVIGVDTHAPEHFLSEDIAKALQLADDLDIKIKDLYIK